MKYNKSYENENFENYVDYLNVIRNKLPKGIFDFFSDSQRHDFSKQSLHDSRVEKIAISHVACGRINITLTLLGAYRDRTFVLRFKKVTQYSISQQSGDMYEDLIAHEIGLEYNDKGKENLVFRAEFSGDKSEIEIYAKELVVMEKLIYMDME
jgi:hypothetical protein